MHPQHHPALRSTTRRVASSTPCLHATLALASHKTQPTTKHIHHTTRRHAPPGPARGCLFFNPPRHPSPPPTTTRNHNTPPSAPGPACRLLRPLPLCLPPRPRQPQFATTTRPRRHQARRVASSAPCLYGMPKRGSPHEGIDADAAYIATGSGIWSRATAEAQLAVVRALTLTPTFYYLIAFNPTPSPTAHVPALAKR